MRNRSTVGRSIGNGLLYLCLGCMFLFGQEWKAAMPGFRFEFPRDHFSHLEYQTEWWYYTGNLRAADGHRYGFELTFFRQSEHLPPEAAQTEDARWRPEQVYLAHLALSDIDGKSFYHTERLNRAGPGLAGAGFSDGQYWNGNWQVRWTELPGEQQELSAVCDRFKLRATLEPLKPPVIQGQNGVSQKGPAPGQASHYISFTRLQAEGELTEKGSTVQVQGLAWMDHEFFTEPASSNLSGWDWFAIQLDNKQELMLYRLRDRSGMADPYSSGAYIDSRGKIRFLSDEEFALTPGELWRSPHSGADYPVSWRISVPSLAINLVEEAKLKDQELWSRDSTAPSYWEGAVTYKGQAGGAPIQGIGYLEMTGYSGAVKLGGMTQK
ncbi:MAG: hypothetical protein JO210_11060 [Acidobacteriaceae bacterium]|nr:hypothetical protein [Acidobacteriaceae bacterium]